ncbi:TetR/AcrR family transcriptional regulator [Rhodococcus tibetensis]|uniref:TetR/AcrR family transcriptional regulator n=1 Tax=Rhodococcus tibetensis TaxID=2965064 RepID=A0ABT1QI18_9NOCA|nr:TetR/AcrR family transcriptional regulator [Rhodococcus sp. FXJ9.536]MCQ4120747.1 TetR/AcrR family transcriptional regulator [Rhodococcus sp. FXJ9.536]
MAPQTDRTLRSDARANLERILLSAREVFTSRGLEATLAEVAEHAGVGVGTVYRRFASKDQLIEHLFVSRLQDVVEVSTAAESMPDPWEGLVYFFTESTRMLAQDRGLRDLVVAGRALPHSLGDPATQGKLAGAVGTAQGEIHRRTAALVERAKEAGALRDDFESTDLPLLTQAVQAAADFASAESPELWKRVLGFALDGLRATRQGHGALGVPALTEDELHRAMNRLHGVH